MSQIDWYYTRMPLGAVLLLVVLSAAACSNDKPARRTPGPEDGAPTSVQRITVGRVVNVVDGVTIDIDINGAVSRVRYMGIAVPSSGPTSSGAPLLGERALQFNRFLVGGKAVEVERGDVDVDKSGRLLRYVYVDGELVNLALLTNGYATVADFPPDFEHKTAFAIAEENARQEQRGFWSADSSAPATPGSGSTEPFTGGTLPAPPGAQVAGCDFSGTSVARIKGNVHPRTKERIYHVPGGFFYETIEVNADEGDRWFCTERGAVAAGWTRSTH